MTLLAAAGAALLIQGGTGGTLEQLAIAGLTLVAAAGLD